jgi:hypothetical protein
MRHNREQLFRIQMLCRRAVSVKSHGDPRVILTGQETSKSAMSGSKVQSQYSRL